jgi:23S rRNA pseudouridine2605 synthase
VLNYLGLDVNRLIRVSYGPFTLGQLEAGEVIEADRAVLQKALGRGFTLD